MDVVDIETGELMRTKVVPDIWRFGPAVGVGVKYGALDVGLRYYFMNQTIPERPTIWTGAMVLHVRAVF